MCRWHSSDKTPEGEHFTGCLYDIKHKALLLNLNVGFALTADKRCPFSFFGSDELSIRGKSNLEVLQTVYNSEMGNIIGFFDQKDLMFYRKMYTDFGCSFHSTRHFSIVAEFVEFDVFGNQMDFERKVMSAIDAFAFRFRAALVTHERGLGYYIPEEDIDKIIGELLSII